MENPTEQKSFDLSALINEKLSAAEAAGDIEGTKGRGRPASSGASSKRSKSGSGDVFDGPSVDPSKVESARPIVEGVLNTLYESFGAKPLTQNESDMMAKSTVALADHYLNGKPVHPALWFAGSLTVCTLARRNEIVAELERRQLAAGDPDAARQTDADVELRQQF